MKKTLIALAVLAAAAATTGCASLTQAGNTAYDLAPVVDEAGKARGYKLTVQDGKEYAARTITFTATPAGTVTLTVSEEGVKAFRGQGIAAKALSVLPVAGLDELLDSR